MRPRDALEKPMRVVAIDGELVFLGEGPANFSMTREAARQTLRNLADALRPEIRAVAVVLLVEHEPAVRELSIAVLEAAGFHVVAAEDAEQALRLLETGLDPKVLFTDVKMRGSIDGLQLARAVRDRIPGVEVLVSSTQPGPEPADLPDRSRFLPKPYAMDELVRHVGELAHGSLSPAADLFSERP